MPPKKAVKEEKLLLGRPGNNLKSGIVCGSVEVINTLFLLTAKPVVYLVNLSEKDFIRQKNKHLPGIAQWIKAQSPEGFPTDPIIPISICFEERLTRFETDAEVDEECKKLGVKSALPKCITTMRKALNLGSFFTTGTDEVRQWTIRNGTKAPQAAGVIHGDFEKTFIQAVVYNYSVLKEENGDEATVKSKGKVMTKGKDYVYVISLWLPARPPMKLVGERPGRQFRASARRRVSSSSIITTPTIFLAIHRVLFEEHATASLGTRHEADTQQRRQALPIH
ncbi:hypothetical protein MRB53_042241 [Persea americana]|nr:hypothetical protein MRB53_042241 [Persea americana]